MADAEQALAALRDTALRAARSLLEQGHTDFWAFAVILGSDGRLSCLVSDSHDLPEVTAALGPSVSSRSLDAPGNDPQSEYDQGLGHTLGELRQLASDGAVRGVALVSNVFHHPPGGGGPVEAVCIEVEHRAAAPVRWLLAYEAEDGELDLGELVAEPGQAQVLGPRGLA